MTRKDLEYYRHLVDNMVSKSKITDPDFQVSLWVKFYSTALHATEKLFTKGRVN